MLRKFLLLSLTLGAFVVPPAVSAQTNAAKSLTQVQYSGSADRIEFRFDAREALAAEDISARLDKGVLVLRFVGFATERRWIKTHDSSIKRVLLHQSNKDGFAAHLRVRMTDKVPVELVENIRVRLDGEALVVSIPRDVATAERWSTASAIEAPSVNDKATESGDAEVAQANQEAVTDGGQGKAAQDKDGASEDTPLSLDQAVSLDERNEAWESAAPEAGNVAPGDGPSAGALGVSFLLLCFVGVVLWRRARPSRPGDVGGPMIKTISTHMLGPKQGLLLVDVAGEKVLLSTSDKGVQMLTRIEDKPGRQNTSNNLKNLLEVGDHEIPTEAINEARSRSLGAQFGRMVDRVRNISDSRAQGKAQASSYAETEGEVASVAEKLTVSELYRQAQMKGISTDAEGYDRREFKPVMPKRAPRLDEVEPPLATGDDLLNRLRDLKSA